MVERYTRREVLAATLATTAGCGGVAGRSGEPVSILAAGSLQRALAEGLEPSLPVPLRVEAHGSAAVAHMVAEGGRDPDIVSLADAALFEGPLHPPWHAVYASNAIVLAYNPDTEGGRRIREAGPEGWWRPLLEDVSLGRTDPDQDPLGYRTLFALELAGRHYEDAPPLRERLPERGQVYPETALLSGFETDAIEAAFAYRTMAEQRGYEYVALPDRVDLSNPAHADWYATTRYTLPDGRTVRGDLIRYAATARRRDERVRQVFEAHVGGEYLANAGFVTPERFPRYEGDVPDAFR
ncbi:MAG: extracellular solute-binding protein [Halobacteriales archaeon]